MVFNSSMSFGDDSDPGSPSALTPVASPQASICCVGVISRFDGLLLQDRSRDGGAVGQMQEENPLGSNDSAGKVYGKKLVLLVALHDDRGRTKAMRLVSGLPGIGSLAMDAKDNKLTVSGDFNPVEVVNKLRKSWPTKIMSFRPAKEDHGKKEEGKKNNDQVANLVKSYQA